MKFAGHEWLNNPNMSELGIKVADILGQIFGGIYHISHLIKKTDWTDSFCIEIKMDQELSNYDFDNLTRLMVMCSDNLIRFSITPLNFRYTKLQFWQRESRTGDISKRLPDLESHLADIRSGIGVINESN